MFIRITLFYNSIIILLLFCYLLQIAHNIEICGKPALYELTNFTVVNNSSLSCLSNHYSNGTVIKYKCSDTNDEIIDRNIINRTCINGKWTRYIPRCAQSLVNKALVTKFEVYDNLFNKTINIAKTKINSFNKLPYLAYSWPHDCHNVTIYDFRQQYLIIHLNTFLSFNYMKLSLTYPEISASKINETNINLTLINNSSIICKSVNSDKYIISHQILQVFSIICELSVEYMTNNLMNKSDKLKLLHKERKEIRLKFDVNEMNSSNKLKVSICKLRLFKYKINDCGVPDEPLNSVVSSNGEFAQFTCNDGYVISPSRSSGYHVKCDLNSQWNDEFPICIEEMYCNLPENQTKFSPLISYNSNKFTLINGKNTTISGTIASYSCENMTINGTKTQLSSPSNPIRTCRRGKWSGPELTCVKMKDNYKIIMQTFNNNLILILLSCVLLFCVIIILLFIIMFWYKRREKKINRKVIIPRIEPQISNDNEFWENDDNRYESIRMSHLTIDSYYEHIYEDVDKSSQRMENNVIYEIDIINQTNNTQTKRGSNSLWESNSTYG